MIDVAELISSLSEQPVVLVGMVVLVGLFVYAVMRRLVKFALVLVLGFAAISSYFAFSGVEAPESIRRIQEEVAERLRRGTKSGAETITTEVGEDLKEATLESLFKRSAGRFDPEEEALEAIEDIKDEAEDLADEISEGF